MTTNRSWMGWIIGLSVASGAFGPLAWFGCSSAPASSDAATRSRALDYEVLDTSTSTVSVDPSAGHTPDATAEAGSEPSPCNCILFPPAELASCAVEELFCNSSGACVCDDSSGPVLRSAQRAAEITAELRAKVSAPVCSCVGGSPSPPEGGCAPEDWYCNPSGRCRCDN